MQTPLVVDQFPEFSDGSMNEVTKNSNALMGYDVPKISEVINRDLIMPVVNFVKDCDNILLRGINNLVDAVNTAKSNITNLTNKYNTLNNTTTQLTTDVNDLKNLRIYRYFFQAGSFRLEARKGRMWQSAITGVTMSDTILFDFFKYHEGEAASQYVLTKGFVYTGNNIRLSMINVADSGININNPQMRVTVIKAPVGYGSNIPTQVVGTLLSEDGETLPLELVDVEEVKL